MADQEASEPAPPLFDPVPLPALAPGQLTAEQLSPPLREWAGSPPMRALAKASGWDWPIASDTLGLLTRLAGLAEDWNFLARERVEERHLMRTGPADVNSRIVPEDLIAAAAQALGMVWTSPVPPEPFTFLAVLAGQVKACVNRTKLAAELLRSGLAADSTVVLGAHRHLVSDEPGQARDLGFGDIFDEADAVLAATREAFDLGDPEESETSWPAPAEWDEALHGASARYRWKEVEVVIVPSSDLGRGRADTTDQLRYWAELAGLGPDDRVLLITTQLYVPFQQLAALRWLGLARGCSVYCSGVDATNSALPLPGRGGREYLLEIRKALQNARELMAAAQQGGD